MHVIDASDPGFERQLEVTDKVLAEISADAVPRIRVFNKIDHVGDATAQAERETALREKDSDCFVSARPSDDVAMLHQTIMTFFQQYLVEAVLYLPWSAQQLRGEIYSSCQVQEERSDNEGTLFRVRSALDTVNSLREQLMNR